MLISNTWYLFTVTFANAKESNYVGMVIHFTMDLELEYETNEYKNQNYVNSSSILYAWLQTSVTKRLKNSPSSEYLIIL